ncbi:hypothetical protein [Streptomyces sp. NPDC059513]|uniref:hypothetical protein n=1 Tax=unclassified Streptomyces TaxID=2593676 RepID=UPI0036BB1D15
MSIGEQPSDVLAPATVLEFSDDLPYVEFTPLHGFLEARLTEAAAAREEGSDPHLPVTSFRDVTRSPCVTLADELSAGEQVALTGQADLPGETQTRRQNTGHGWSQLVTAAERLSCHPGHLPRWRTLPHMFAEHAEFVAAAEIDRRISDSNEATGAHP